MKNEDIKTVPAVVHIPENTVKLTMIAKIIDENDDMVEVKSELKLQDVIRAMADGEDWFPDDAVFTLTDKAKKELGIE